MSIPNNEYIVSSLLAAPHADDDDDFNEIK